MGDDFRDSALEYHRLPKPGKLAVVATKPLANQRDLALAYSPGVAAACEAIVADPAEAATVTGRANLVAVDHERHGRAGARRHRAAGRQAGDGGKGRPLQDLRRHRRLRPRAQRARPRQARRHHRQPGAHLRRHQPRGHQGARVLRDRAPVAGAVEDPGLPRRSARHRHHRRRRHPQRPQGGRQGPEAGEAGDVGRRRGRVGLPRPAGLARAADREHHRDRYRRRRLSRPQGRRWTPTRPATPRTRRRASWPR